MKQKKPCAKDKEILSYLQSYPHLSSIQIQQMAGVIDHRDAIHRLRKGGYNIFSWRVNYVNKEGEHRWFMNYRLEQQKAAQCSSTHRNPKISQIRRSLSATYASCHTICATATIPALNAT